MLQRVRALDIAVLGNALRTRFEDVTEDEISRLWKVMESFLKCFPPEAGAQIREWSFGQGCIERLEAKLQELEKENNYFTVSIRFTRTRYALVTYFAPGPYLIQARDELLTYVNRAPTLLSPVLSRDLSGRGGTANKALADRANALELHREKLTSLAPESAALVAMWILRYLTRGHYKAGIPKRAVLETLLCVQLPNLASEEEIEKALDTAYDRKQISMSENVHNVEMITILKAGREVASAHIE